MRENMDQKTLNTDTFYVVVAEPRNQGVLLIDVPRVIRVLWWVLSTSFQLCYIKPNFFSKPTKLCPTSFSVECCKCYICWFNVKICIEFNGKIFCIEVKIFILHRPENLKYRLSIGLTCFSFEPSFKLWWCCAQDLSWIINSSVRRRV